MKLFNGTKGQTNTNVTHVLKCNISSKFLRSGVVQFCAFFQTFSIRDASNVKQYRKSFKGREEKIMK